MYPLFLFIPSFLFSSLTLCSYDDHWSMPFSNQYFGDGLSILKRIERKKEKEREKGEFDEWKISSTPPIVLLDPRVSNLLLLLELPSWEIKHVRKKTKSGKDYWTYWPYLLVSGIEVAKYTHLHIALRTPSGSAGAPHISSFILSFFHSSYFTTLQLFFVFYLTRL